MKKLIFGLILLLLPLVAYAQDRQSPDLRLKDLRGRSLRLSDYRGKVVLINFWATWCPPCRAEMPDLVKLQREHKKDGLQIIGVTYPPEQPALVRKLTRRLKINYPILFGTYEAAAFFEVGANLPVTIILNRDGTIRDRVIGILEPEEFDEKVKPLLQSSDLKNVPYNGRK